MPKSPAGARRHEISPEVLPELDALLEAGFRDRQAAEELNRRGHRDSKGEPFFQSRIAKIRARLNIPSCPDRQRAKLREKGYVTAAELAIKLQIPIQQVYIRASKGHGIQRYRFKVGKRYYSMCETAPESANEPQ